MDETLPKLASKAVLKQLHGSSHGERLLHRLHAVVLVAAGLPASEVARVFGDSPRAVAYWVSRYRVGGVAALREEARPGRPSKLTPDQLLKLQLFVNRRPPKMARPTPREVADFVAAKFGVALTTRHCRRILERLNA